MASPKAQKRGDMDRILRSGNSEDYVTWNYFQLLERLPASTWWPALLMLAGVNSVDYVDPPVIRLWQAVAAPPVYETLSRARMQTAAEPVLRQWSCDPRPVEGSSEIDITFEGRSYLAFVEAKLGSDVSLRTTYDPERDQIARNIDCLLEACGSRRPMFWMFVWDLAPTRAYVQLMNQYRSVTNLERVLPHRAKTSLELVASSLAIIRWADLMALLPQLPAERTEAAVEGELGRRVKMIKIP
jgi:hypothetical protein